MQTLDNLNDNVLFYALGYLGVNDSAAMAATAKQFSELVQMSSRLLLIHISTIGMSRQFLSPVKCMAMNFVSIKRFLLLALAYTK